MNTERYTLIFEGKLREGESLPQVKMRLAALFRVDAARVESLFNRSATILKRGLSAQEALRYQQMLVKTGAVCRLTKEAPEPSAAVPPPPAAVPAAAPAIPPPMTCPKCGFEQAGGGRECVRCGIIFERFQTRSESDASDYAAPRKTRPPRGASEDRAEIELGVCHVEREGWLALAVGLALTVVVMVFPFLAFIFSYLKVLVHELGHAVLGWLFGYQSIPAFDFTYGGGLTMQQDRQTLLLLVVYAGLAWLFFLYRRNRATLVVLGILVLGYSLAAFTQLHEILILFMGHGAELIFVGIFLYRAISGFGVIVALERPLYAFVGLFIEFLDVQFAYQLLTSHAYRVDYEEAKGGGHWMDFSRIAEEFLHVNLTAVAVFFLVCCLLTPLLTFLFYRYQAYLLAALLKIVKTEG